MGNESSIPSINGTVAFDIPASVIRFNGECYTMAVTAEQARGAAWMLLSMAGDADRITHARNILHSAIGLATPAIENWDESLHRPATPARDWFSPEGTLGSP